MAKKKLASNVVVVPKPARGSYNPNRPLAKNTLLLNQVRHFQEVEDRLPPDQRTGHDPKKIRTEGQAAAYLKKMTTLLHPQAAKPGRVKKTGGK